MEYIMELIESFFSGVGLVVLFIICMLAVIIPLGLLIAYIIYRRKK